VGVAAIYTLKFLFLKISGWLFSAYEAANTYIFIVFTSNKIIGITILPFIVIIAFTYGTLNKVGVIASISLIILIYLYRFFLTFLSINKMIKVNFLHLLIYLAAFEILPILLINKLLFVFVAELL
jgi:hypothetical protein